jgi:hypothetical protein
MLGVGALLIAGMLDLVDEIKKKKRSSKRS